MSQHRLPPLLARGALLVGLALSGACAASREGEVKSPERASSTATVEVDNRGFADMTVYVIDGARRVRLGVANGNSVTKLAIPAYLVRTGLTVRFLCDPIGSNRAPVSEEIVVDPGDTVVLQIPPN